MLIATIGFCKPQSSPTPPSLSWGAVSHIRTMACWEMGWRHPSRSVRTNVGRLGSLPMAPLLYQWTCTNFGWELCHAAALGCGKRADGSWGLFGWSEYGLDSSFWWLRSGSNLSQSNSFVIYDSTIKQISAKNLKRSILDILVSIPSIHFQSMPS